MEKLKYNGADCPKCGSTLSFDSITEHDDLVHRHGWCDNTECGAEVIELFQFTGAELGSEDDYADLEITGEAAELLPK